MPIKESLNAKPVTLGDLLGNGKRYVISHFQRNYAWDEPEWAELWDDICQLHAHQNERAEHYLGAIVLQSLEASSDRRIIDGQQRLVTLSLLALAVIGRIQHLADDGKDADDNRERVRLLREKFVSTRHPASLQYHPRLSLNRNDNPYYSTYLVQGQRGRRTALKGSLRRLHDALCFFEIKLTQLFGETATGQTLAAFLDDVVAARLRFIEIVVEDDETAYTVFETLNARGIALGTADLLKNYLFHIASHGGEPDLESAIQLWDQIINLVPMDQVSTMFFHKLAGRVSGLREKRVFAEVKRIVPGQVDVFAFLREMKDTADIYAALDDPSAPFWVEFPGARREIERLKLLRIEQVRPLILAALPRLEGRPERFVNLLRRLVVLAVRSWVVRVNTGDIQRAYQEAALATERGELRSPRAMAHKLRGIHVSDEQFRAAFAQLSLSPKGPRRQVVRYLLSELEVGLGGQPIDFEGTDATVEHILPENPGGNFPAFSGEVQRDSLIRLGNLTPLEFDKNRALGSADFARKRQVFATSKFRLTQAIVSTEWTPDAVRARQGTMADIAVRVWSADDAPDE
ncbi:MAG: DUF262 domain-containing protein [Myxococcales bacterium]|nr:DUF262 domain-containing protein [Myxococcales bacterium]